MTKSPLGPLETSLARLLERIEPVEPERLSAGDVRRLAGRVLAEPVRRDRDSPACDVSAMDGYAVRAADVANGWVDLAGECRIGSAPPAMAPGTALRVFTGCAMPAEADAVLRLEVSETEGGRVRLAPDRPLAPGDDVRRRAENAAAGDRALSAGGALTAAAAAELASIGPPTVAVRRALRLAILTTGDEVESPGTPAAELPPWRLVNANGPALETLFGGLSWVETLAPAHVADEPDRLGAALARAVDAADAVLLTGGVSKGAYDHVPDVVRRVGGEVVFHGLAARPGRPTLGAIAHGKPILGLPGNPLAVLCCGRRVAAAALRCRAGFDTPDPAPPTVELRARAGKPIPLTWWRPVRLVGMGQAELASLRGSGDTSGPAMTDGFVEVPPGDDTRGPYAYYPWSI